VAGNHVRAARWLLRFLSPASGAAKPVAADLMPRAIMVEIGLKKTKKPVPLLPLY
jgi:hypothetical protein